MALRPPKPAKSLTPAQKAAERRATVANAQKALAEAKALFRDADTIRSKSETLLRPDDIMSGAVDAGRLWKFMTRNRDGTYRPITFEDVIEFDRRRGALRTRWEQGITARDIIELSSAVVPGQNESDLSKARRQIHTAVPIATRGGELRFATNTGPNSDRDRQYVTIQMLNFTAAMSSPEPATALVKDVTGGKLAIGCSCGQWRFVFAYMATTGGYGLPDHRETAFPKIRNPVLAGVACKHIVRVAANLIQSPTLKTYIARLIEAERNKTQTRIKREAMALQADIAENMAKESYRQRSIQTEAEKREKRMAQPAQQRRTAEQAAAKKVSESAAKKSAKKAQMAIQKQGIDAILAQAEKGMRQVPNLSESAIRAALAVRRKELMKELKK